MRQITRNSVNAFVNKRDFHSQNMSIVSGAEVEMRLHGNAIASCDIYEGMYATLISNAGWESTTTKDRLNALVMEITNNEWRLCSVKGQWLFWSTQHGEEVPMPYDQWFPIQTLVDITNTIRSERAARAA